MLMVLVKNKKIIDIALLQHVHVGSYKVLETSQAYHYIIQIKKELMQTVSQLEFLLQAQLTTIFSIFRTDDIKDERNPFHCNWIFCSWDISAECSERFCIHSTFERIHIAYILSCITKMWNWWWKSKSQQGLKHKAFWHAVPAH